ncbi:UNVERIFIED_CONTAM: hypothetical protein Sindi_1841700 [Sesamum indicum]
MRNAPIQTGLYVGNIPLHAYPEPIIDDKIAHAFNHSTWKTLSFIAPTMQNGEVIVRPSLDAVRNGSKRWKSTAVGYFLGKRPYYHHLKEFAHSVWPALREVTATTKGFFFFQFKTVFDMEEIIEGGPWLFQGQPIVLQKWEPGMAMRKLKHTQVPVWIKLRHLPMEFWTTEELSTVASGVGKPLYPDAITRACTRLDFARVCVMIDATQKLHNHIIVMAPDEEGRETPCKIDVELHFLGILETRVRLNNVMHIQSFLLPHWKWFVDYSSVGNRIWLAWDENVVDVHILDLADQFIHCRVTNMAINESVIITVVYGASEVIDRRNLWTALETLTQQCSDIPWMVGGDFNAVRDLNKVCGILGDIRMATEEFNAGILEAGLIPLPMQGEWFTWHNCSTSMRSLWKRLDRILINDRWLARFPSAYYHSLTPRTSDHSPLNIWHHEIVGIPMYAVTRKLKALKPVFRLQRRNKGDLTMNVQLAKGFLDEAQQLVSSDRQNELYLLLEHCCQIVYAKAAKLEQIMLQQRAKMQWMKDGDQCSRVFFRKIAQRRVMRRILQINDENGFTHTDLGEVAHEFVSYYQNLLGGTRRRLSVDIRYLRPWTRHCITDEEANQLLLPFSAEDVKQAVFDIADDKAPGPDGYSSRFFKAAWPVVGEEVTRAVLDFFSTGKLLKQINSTILALIPKMRLPPRYALKVDIRKTYDTVEWDFLLAVLQLFGFPPTFTRWIEECVSTTSFSIGLNGKPHGFFSGARGLRQGDPLSPYLFALVMEALHLGFLQLKLNRTSNSLIIGSEGHLPMRYLGLPLISSRLSISDCQPLISKIDARINGWEGILLSYAGRVQIIKSVLSALSLYWASAFILPKKVINEIEKRLRTFLWKGTTSSGYTKVAWKDVCRPMDEEGLGFKDISTLNRALMSKKLCDVIQCDRTSIWVQWLYQDRLRERSIWTISEHGGSWGWRKILRLRPFLRSIVDYQIGNGDRFFVWQDPWHHLGPLIERFPQGPRHLRLEESAKLRSVISAGEWQWPTITDFECLEITHNLLLIFGGEDRVVWRCDKGQPTTQALYRLFDHSEPKVGWSSLLSGSLKIPRVCILCDEGATESHPHLFFRCRFSRQCLSEIRRRIPFHWPNRDWATDIEWATRKWRGKHIIDGAYRTLLASCVYHIWRERNLRRFEHTERTPATLSILIIDDVRQRILSIDLASSVSTRALYRLWRIPWVEGETI